MVLTYHPPYNFYLFCFQLMFSTKQLGLVALFMLHSKFDVLGCLGKGAEWNIMREEIFHLHQHQAHLNNLKKCVNADVSRKKGECRSFFPVRAGYGKKMFNLPYQTTLCQVKVMNFLKSDENFA